MGSGRTNVLGATRREFYTSFFALCMWAKFADLRCVPLASLLLRFFAETGAHFVPCLVYYVGACCSGRMLTSILLRGGLSLN